MGDSKKQMVWAYCKNELQFKSPSQTLQQQSHGGVLQKMCSWYFRKTHRKRPAPEALQHSCFRRDFNKFLRTVFCREHLRWLLLPLACLILIKTSLNKNFEIVPWFEVLSLHVFINDHLELFLKTRAFLEDLLEIDQYFNATAVNYFQKKTLSMIIDV